MRIGNKTEGNSDVIYGRGLRMEIVAGGSFCDVLIYRRQEGMRFV